MGAAFRTVRAAAITAGGPTQDFTISGLGPADEIVAAEFVVTRATADNTSADHAALSVGITDGTRHRVFSVVAEDGQNPTDSSHRAASDEVIQILALDGTIDGEAAFDSFITDGVRINWGNLPAAAYLVTVTLYVGSSLNARVDELTTNATNGNTTVVSSLGGRPFAAKFYCNYDAVDDTSRDDCELSMGFLADGASIEQACWYQFSESGVSPSSVAGRAASDRVVCQSDTSNLATAGAEVTAISSSGFTVTTRDGAGGHVVAFLALWSDAGHSASAGLFTLPTATGNDAETGLGFEPCYLTFVFTQTTLAGQVNNNRAGVQGVGTASSPTEEFGNCITTQDGQTTSNTTSFTDDELVRARSATGAADGSRGTLVSFDSDGWTINFANVFGTARVFPFLAIENVFVLEGGGTDPADDASGVAEQRFEASGAGVDPADVGAGTLELRFELSGGGTDPVDVGAGALELRFEASGAGVDPADVGGGTVEQRFELSGAGVDPVDVGAGVAEQRFELSGAGTDPADVGAGNVEIAIPLEPLEFTIELPAVVVGDEFSLSGGGTDPVDVGAGVVEQRFELSGGGTDPVDVGAGAADLIFDVSGGGAGSPDVGGGTVEQRFELAGGGTDPVDVGAGTVVLAVPAELEPLDFTLDLPAIEIGDQVVRPDPLDLTMEIPDVIVRTGVGPRRLEFRAVIGRRVTFTAEIT